MSVRGPSRFLAVSSQELCTRERYCWSLPPIALLPIASGPGKTVPLEKTVKFCRDYYRMIQNRRPNQPATQETTVWLFAQELTDLPHLSVARMSLLSQE